MKRTVLALLFVITSFTLSPSCFGQDVLADNRVRGLKGLSTVSLAFRPNTPTEIISLKEWGDMVELRLHRDIPELKLTDTNNPPWLELGIITSDAGGFLGLSVYRWVRVLDSKEEILAKVWDDSRVVLGKLSNKRCQIHSLNIGKAIIESEK
jgi:hypothetical protein